jgi:tight adherence protein B
LISATLAIISCISAAALGFFGVVSLLSSQSRRLEMRDQLRIAAGDTNSSSHPSSIHSVSVRFENSKLGKSLATQLAQADLTVSASFFAVALLGIAMAIFLAAWFFFQAPFLIDVVLAGGLTWLFAKFFLDARRDHYINQVANQMPEVAILVSNALKAGLSVSQSFAMVAEEMPAPAGKEFSKIVTQLNLGNPFDGATENMMKRLPAEELKLLLTTITIQRKAGGNLTRALAVMSSAISARHRARNEIATLTAEARYTGLIVLVLPIAMLVMINSSMEGAVSAFLNHPIAWVILPIFIGIQAVSVFLIRRYSEVKV